MKIINIIVRAGVFSVCTSLGLLPLSSQVHATTDLEQGLQAQSNGELASAAKYFQTAAEAGNSEGQYQLGLLYAQGIGIEADFANAKILIQKAADQGHILATEWLGLQNLSAAPAWEEEEEDPEDDC
tara:strand:- start:237 stop:617 length:381 start_codon:yes stop_codon:yes gene_type:complete